MLELLERLRRIEFVHKDVGTKAELQHYLSQSAENDPSVRDYFTLYLAFHGSERTRAARRERTIWISDADDGQITLRELATILGGRLKGVVVHFGVCTILAETDEILEEFQSDTGVAAIAGYTGEVDWVPSAVMDLVFLDVIAGYSHWSRAKDALNRNETFQTLLRDGSLGFQIWPR